MDGWGIVCRTSTVGNGVAPVPEFVRAWVALYLVAEATEERDNPGVAGERRCTLRFREPLQAALEDVPEFECVAVRLSDVVAEGAVVWEAEVTGPLTAELGGIGAELLEQVGREEAADQANGGGGGTSEFLGDREHHSTTPPPRLVRGC